MVARQQRVVLSAAAAVVVAVLGAILLAPAAGATSTAASACTAPAQFTSVAAVTSSDAWAAGNCWNGATPRGLIEHWNGRRWRAEPAPGPGVGVGFSGITAVSASYAWAVGGSAIERWNGRKWALVRDPVADVSLDAVWALTRSDAWAVGYLASTASVAQTVILHWNGRGWGRVASPDPGGVTGASYLYGVGGSSAGSVWAVGYYSSPTTTAADSLILHWNGRAWAHVPSPNPAGSVDSPLNAVAAVSGSDAWAVGAAIVHSVTWSVILQWNGRHWRQVVSPNPGGSRGTALSAVAAASKSSAWAVGSYGVGLLTAALTLIVRWNGRHWQQVDSPSPGGDTSTNLLEGIAATRSGPAWAVGCYTKNPGNCGTLAVRYARSRWQQVASTPGP